MSRKELSSETIGAVLKGINVPSQPLVLRDVLMEQSKPELDMQRVAHLISQDAGLAGSVLKVVNSKDFELPNKIASIQQAVELLGFNSIVHIINVLSVKSELDDDALEIFTKFWDAETEVAMTCAHISNVIGFQSPDLAYTLGLFHNCGMPMLTQSHDNYDEVIQQAYATDAERVIDIENSALKTNHAVVGFYAAKSWGLPMDMCEVIAEHHSAYDIFNSVRYSKYSSHKKTLLSILKMAEHINKLYSVIGHQEQDHEWSGISAPLLDHVGLMQDEFEDLRDEVEDLQLSQSLNLKSA